MATNADIYRYCCDLLLDADSAWVRRRKETAELVTETLLKHVVTVDFIVDGAPVSTRNDEDIAFVPVTLLPKEPGAFTRFDFTDESGRSVPLPTRTHNANVAAGVLVEAAHRVLKQVVTPALRAELSLIARTNRNEAEAIVSGAYRSPEGPISQDADADNRALLWANPRFSWLLQTLARSSVVVAAFPLDERPRRILKLSYDEHIEDVTTLRKRAVRAKLGALLHRFGWRGYLLVVYSPFVGAGSYHFELHAPEGTQILAAGLNDGTEGPSDPRRVHLYVHDARDRQSSVAWAQFRIRGPGFVPSAAIASLAITISLVAAIWQAPQLKDTTTSSPALLLLFPGLVGSYLARPTHPLVGRLLKLARWTLLAAAATAYAAAARLAIVSKDHPASAESLRDFFVPAATVAGVATIALLAGWWLPRPKRATPPAVDREA